jgi:hypothetical protein
MFRYIAIIGTLGAVTKSPEGVSVMPFKSEKIEFAAATA